MTVKRKPKKERGVFLILFAFLILVILAFIALALDTANSTMAKLRVYKAVDNAIMTAPLLYLGETYTDSEIETRLDALTRANYEADRIKATDVIDVTVAVNLADVQIDSTIRTKFWLAPVIFDSGPTATLQGRTRLRIPRVNIAVVLDTSHSMQSPDPNKPTLTKIQSALGGLQDLGNWLRDNFDRVAVIITSDYSQRVADFDPVGGFDSANLVANLGALMGIYGSWTNLSAGLYDARENFESISWPPDDYNLTAVMSDGYLTHGRANFSGSGNPSLNPNTTSFGNFDYHFQLEANRCFDGCGGPTEIHGPIRYTLRMNPLTGNPPWFGQSPTCQSISYVDTEATYNQDRYHSIITPNCLSFARIIGGDGATIDLGALNGAEDGADGDKLRELAYYSVIAQADALRYGGAHVVSLSIGGAQPAPTSHNATLANPVRVFSAMAPVNSTNDFGHTFFRRVAMSPKGLSDVPFPQVPSIPALLANPVLADVLGEHYEAHATYAGEESLRLLFGQMEFKKEF
jgi:Flp pilus assembly protein TadG